MYSVELKPKAIKDLKKIIEKILSREAKADSQHEKAVPLRDIILDFT